MTSVNLVEYISYPITVHHGFNDDCLNVKYPEKFVVIVLKLMEQYFLLYIYFILSLIIQ